MRFFKITDTVFIKLNKAKPTKFLFKKPDGKGGWKYFYKENKDRISVNIESKFNPVEVFNVFNNVGFEEKVGNFNKKNKKLIENCDKIESLISNKKDFEYCNVLDEKGKLLLSKKGLEDKVEFEDKEIKIIKNTKILTHNHIENKSLSPDDIFLSLFLGIEEIRAVFKNKKFSFKLSYKEKSKDYEKLQEKNKKILIEIDKITKEIQNNLQQLIFIKKITIKEANYIEQRKICEKIQENDALRKLLNMEYKEYDKNNNR